tara:strand:- start:352 stop:705 length:354 start_codon:yes stop_codon:yes gene_type:complete
MTKVLQIEYTLTDEELENILEMAGYGCNYWADSMDIADDYSSVTFHDCEQEESHTLTKDDIEASIITIAECKKDVQLHISYRQQVFAYIIDNDKTVCDSDMADWIIQNAIFGEVIYG